MKPFYLSKIFWVNIISILIELGQTLLDFQIVPPGMVLIVMNILNIILRFLTDQAVYLSKPKT
jgi:hypothetical protein